MAIETSKDDLGALGEESALEYETDEEEFDPGPRSSRPSNMHLVTLGQSNWSPGDTLLIKTECPQVQDEHPWLKSACEGEDETGDGVNEMVIEYETDEEEFENSGNTADLDNMFLKCFSLA